MKKPAKTDIYLLVCMLSSCLLGLVMMIVESFVGDEVLWLRLPTTFLFTISAWVIISNFCVKVIIDIIEYRKEKKKDNKK